MHLRCALFGGRGLWLDGWYRGLFADHWWPPCKVTLDILSGEDEMPYNRQVALELAEELRELVVAYVENIDAMPDEPAVMNPLCERLGKIIRELKEPGSILELQ